MWGRPNYGGPKRPPTKPALVAAVDLLARQEYSESRLYEKLQAKGYEDEEIAAAMAKLQEKHYLNDEESCPRRFNYLYTDSSYSVRQICEKLKQKGYPYALVKSCIPEDREAVNEREYEKALRVLESKYKRSQDKQKLMAALFRRGYQSSAIYRAVNEFLSDNDE
ncbi:putative regulatory protein RecX [Selenomonas ruminantium subsp. lactilytica TAM6421]|uniref:Regulatory protein RecX n=1 Tax=Selenomonas ruminantium subsp. lactilytica (strain NBRC 103574 / TAM6421) TaxID=927704 RepID=I0GTA4_SELRL|nr:regulatory protein RecX [Selenomonas ruminantium]BAL83991.1 putative regulatory protein RecX [Selenomonas ruminantium subsp. lactilytica TAM6421]